MSAEQIFRRAALTLALLVARSSSTVAQVPNSFTAGTPAKAAEVNANFAYVDARLVPIGAIVAWNKHIKGVDAPLTLPAGWVECNGQTLVDSESPLNGLVVPDLNGVEDAPGRFLRGGIVSGTLQEATAVWSPSERGGGASDLFFGEIAEKGDQATAQDFDAWTGPGSDGRLAVSAVKDGGVSRSDRVRVRPRNMSVVWIMRTR